MVLVVKETLLLFISTGRGNRRLRRRIFSKVTLPRTSHFRSKLLPEDFLAAESPTEAILRAEGLLLPVDGQPHLHQLTETWDAWKASLLAQDGEPYVPPVKEALAAEPSDEMTRQELPGDVATESHPGRRKVKRLRGVQPADSEGGEHAHPA